MPQSDEPTPRARRIAVPAGTLELCDDTGSRSVGGLMPQETPFSPEAVARGADAFARAVDRIRQRNAEATLGYPGLLEEHDERVQSYLDLGAGDDEAEMLVRESYRDTVSPGDQIRLHHELADADLQVDLVAIGLLIRPVAPDEAPPYTRFLGDVRLSIDDPDRLVAFLTAAAEVEVPEPFARALARAGEHWLTETVRALPEEQLSGSPVLRCAAAAGGVLLGSRAEEHTATRLSALGVALQFGSPATFVRADLLGLFDRPGFGGPSRAVGLFDPYRLGMAWQETVELLTAAAAGRSSRSYAGVLLGYAGQHLRFCRARCSDLGRIASSGNSLTSVQAGVQAVLDRVECDLRQLADKLGMTAWRSPGSGSAEAA